MNNMTLRTGARARMFRSGSSGIRVIVSRYPAEFGRRVGGVVNVVTKSGGNRVTGEVLEFFSNKSLNRVDKFQQAQHDQFGSPINDFHRNQCGVSLGSRGQGPHSLFMSLERKDSLEFFKVNTGKPQFYSALEGT